MQLSRVVIPLAVAAASLVGIQGTASSAALAAPGGTGHTVTMTEITHGVFDAGRFWDNTNCVVYRSGSWPAGTHSTVPCFSSLSRAAGCQPNTDRTTTPTPIS